MRKREFLKGLAALGASAAFMTPAAAQRHTRNNSNPLPAPSEIARGAGTAEIPHRKLRTTKLFKSPQGHPNSLHATQDGLWIGEQRTPDGIGQSNDAFLVDWSGRVLRHVPSQANNSSGLALGNGRLWMGANAPPNGVYETDMSGRTVRRRQVPLGPPGDGGGVHGLLIQGGKIYISTVRLRGILRVDLRTWQPELLIPSSFARLHDMAWDPRHPGGAIWMVVGQPQIDKAPSGLAKYDAVSGDLLETAEFLPGSADPHGLTMWRDQLYTCDAGFHPGWESYESKTGGSVSRVDFT